MWKMWEARPSTYEKRYKWRHSWQEKPGDDYVAFHGERQIGRIFRINEPWSKDRWFWIIHTEGEARLNWPTAGYEEWHQTAVYRVETVYDEIQSGHARAVAD